MSSGTITAAEQQAIDERIHARRWFTLATLCLSLLIIVMDNTILNVAIPSLVRDLGASNSQLQWIVDGYTLVFAGLLLTAGSFGDRRGRKRALRIGIVIFAIGSVLSALAGSPQHLIFTRALMGIGGALIMPSTLSILINVFRDPRERGRAIAIWAGFSGIAVALGPITGGLLLQHFSWSSVFWVNLPISIAALTLGYFFVPESKDPNAPRLDLPGALLSIATLAFLLFAHHRGAGRRLDLGLGAGCVRHRPRRTGRLHRLGAAHRPPDARHVVLQEPPVLGRQHRDHAQLLRPVRLAVPDDPVLAVRARLLAHPGRGAAGPVRRRP